ncbi:lytic transglycosylase domain-containing protein [uncultured Roseovarius sp.]|uniref:lytic transglycosylase domain-containing protein n=1 Tax=uncultured Roseovarius sp. TaxID=293344 RepID=UPI00261F9082|nr:lytic transglycosylase domain-containing protein [uncultured Roseovarius sp.]
MLFGWDGSVRTTVGWNFHDSNASREFARKSAFRSSGRHDVLRAIRVASARHEKNRTIRKLGLSSDDWHVLFRALIEAESAYRPNAVSPKGAYGLGQLMPKTAHRLGVDRKDMAQNLDGAARYLLTQLTEFRDVDLALAAYNAGPHRVTEYGGVPPFQETRTYITRVNRIRARLSNSPIQESVRVSTRGPLRPAVEVNHK